MSAGQATARQMAMLADRIRFHEGRPQCYGCVLDWDDHGESSCEVEGGRPPADLADYRRRKSAWARQVGWRQ